MFKVLGIYNFGNGTNSGLIGPSHAKNTKGPFFFILFFFYSHSHSHSLIALCNVYPVALEGTR